MPYFAVRMQNGPNYDESRGRREQRGWDEHAAYMDRLVEEGFIVIGGPVNETQTLHAIEADSEDEVRARWADDPWAPLGILEIASIEPWQLWLDGRAST